MDVESSAGIVDPGAETGPSEQRSGALMESRWQSACQFSIRKHSEHAPKLHHGPRYPADRACSVMADLCPFDHFCARQEYSKWIRVAERALLCKLSETYGRLPKPLLMLATVLGSEVV